MTWVLEQSRCDVLARLDDGWDIYGPEINARDAHQPERLYHVRWSELSAHVATRIPWWPVPLRRREEMMGWHPDDTELLIPASHTLDTSAVLRTALDAHPDSPVRATLQELAHTIHLRHTRATQREVEAVESSDVAQFARIAARPTPVTRAQPPVDEFTRQRAWMEMLQRSDHLAGLCVHTARGWNGGDDFPYSTVEQLTGPLSEPELEWFDRLQPLDLKNAPVGCSMVRRSKTTALYIDPLTAVPASADAQGDMVLAVPHQLPTDNPLDQVVLCGQAAWVRTTDGCVWPMPQRGGAGLSWGYHGNGPLTLATMIGRLLEDITSPAVSRRNGEEPPEGLYRLVSGECDDYAVLTRAQLEAAGRN